MSGIKKLSERSKKEQKEILINIKKSFLEAYQIRDDEIDAYIDENFEIKLVPTNKK